MKIKSEGVNFIKSHEALRPSKARTARACGLSAGGHTKVHPGDVITTRAGRAVYPR